MPQHVTAFVPALLAALLVTVALGASWSSATHAAEDCLTEPNLQAAQGGRWYYRIDRATGRKCWFLGPQGMKLRRAQQAKGQPLPMPIPRPAIDPPSPATAGEQAETEFSARLSDVPEAVESIRSETALMRDPARDEGSETNAHHAMPLIWPVLTDAELAAAQPANPEHMPVLLGTALAGLVAFAAIGWAMFARIGGPRAGQRAPRDRTGGLPNPKVGHEEMPTEIMRAVTASRYPRTAPEPERAPDPSSDRLDALEEIHRNLEGLEPDPLSDRLHELKEVQRHLDELLSLLRGPQRTAA